MQGALKNTQPFATSDVMETKVFTSSTKHCSVQRKAQKILVCDKALLPEINKIGLKRFKAVVLSPDEFVPYATVARGKNSAMYLPSYKGVLTDDELNIFLTRFFLHELGHGFGLRDEYAFERRADKDSIEQVSDNIAYQSARPNCAPSAEIAKAWWGNYAQVPGTAVGFNEGCSGEKGLIFPEKDTLMSDNPQDANYGIISEDYIRGAYDCLYGIKGTIGYTEGGAQIQNRIKSCSDFKALYPNFWTE